MLANQSTVRVVRPVAGNGPNSDVAKNKTSNIKAVETMWSLFFDLGLFSPIKITFKQFGGHFEFFWWPF